MADENGTAVQAALAYDNSVKQDDYSKTVTFVFPAYGFGNGSGFGSSSAVLPQHLPRHNRYAFYSDLEWVLMRTPHHEGMWADAVATAVSKASAWGWEVS